MIKLPKIRLDKNGSKKSMNKEPQKPPNLIKLLPPIIVLAIALIFVSSLFRGNKEEDITQINSSEFNTLVEQGEVYKVEIINKHYILGEYVYGAGQEVLSDKEEPKWDFKTTYEIDSAYLEKLDKYKVKYNLTEKSASGWGSLVWWVLIGLLWIFIIFGRRGMGGMGGMGGNIFNFGKSKHQEFGAEDESRPKERFKDVAGIEESKKEVEEIVDFLKNHKKYSRLGGEIPKGVLLMGPPGCGKTLLAKAVAGEAMVPFISASGAGFVEMFVGVGASRVRDLFNKAIKRAPSIVFIDEIDAVGRHRGAGLGGGHDEREQTLNAILEEMQGFRDDSVPVIVIAATNRPDVLDPALLRPGRFDRKVVIPLPDVKGREAILKLHAKNKKLAKEVDLGKIAQLMPGASGADLKNVLNEATLLAERRDAHAIKMKDIDEAVDKVQMGTERKTLVMSDEERDITAYHEAGHALLAELLPEHDSLNKVTIIPRGLSLGVTQMLSEEKQNYSLEFLKAKLVVGYGGRVAEEFKFGPEKITTGAKNDIDNVSYLARKMVCEWGMSEKLGLLSFGQKREEIFLAMEFHERKNYSEKTAEAIDEEVNRITQEALEKARKLIKENKKVLHTLAQALIEKETLIGKEVRELIKKSSK